VTRQVLRHSRPARAWPRRRRPVGATRGERIQEEPATTYHHPLSGSDAISRNSLTITACHIAGEQAIALRGEFDVASVGLLEDAVARACASELRAITLDLSELSFIDSSGLWTITSLSKWCSRRNVKLQLVRGPEPVHDIFELTGLSDLLPFAE